MSKRFWTYQAIALHVTAWIVLIGAIVLHVFGYGFVYTPIVMALFFELGAIFDMLLAISAD